MRRLRGVTSGTLPILGERSEHGTPDHEEERSEHSRNAHEVDHGHQTKVRIHARIVHGRTA